MHSLQVNVTYPVNECLRNIQFTYSLLLSARHKHRKTPSIVCSVVSSSKAQESQREAVLVRTSRTLGCKPQDTENFCSTKLCQDSRQTINLFPTLLTTTESSTRRGLERNGSLEEWDPGEITVNLGVWGWFLGLLSHLFLTALRAGPRQSSGCGHTPCGGDRASTGESVLPDQPRGEWCWDTNPQ